MHHRFLISCLVVLLLLAGAASAQSQLERVLVIGDSWSHVECSELQNCFVDQELPTIAVNGAVPGIQAATMATPADLQRVTSLLAAYPSVDTVQFTIGLNDFLGNWNAGLSKAVERALFDQIHADVVTVLNAIFAQRPDLTVILPSYDYLNFEDLRHIDPLVQLGWTWLGSPSPYELNTAMEDFDSRKRLLADSDPRITFCDLYGDTQRIFGYPDLGIPAYSPLLPDVTLPSPRQSMNNGGNDPIHLAPSAYFSRAALMFHGFYRSHFGFFDTAPGSGEDFIMQVSINGDTSASASRVAHAGDVIDVFYGSLFSTFVGASPAMVFQLFGNSLPASPPGFPEIHISGGSILEAGYDASGPIFMPDEGRTIMGIVVPVIGTGANIIFQGFAVSSIAENGFFATTPGVIVKLR